MPNALDRIPPGLTEERLEVELHKLRYQYNTELKEETQNFINSTIFDAEDVPEYFATYKSLLSKIFTGKYRPACRVRALSKSDYLIIREKR